MTTKKVLFISPVGEKGGAETVLLDIASRLDSRSYAASVACLKPGSFVDELHLLGIPAHALAAHQTRQLHKVAAAIRSLAAIIRNEKVDIVHANGSSLLLYAGLASAHTKAKVVWQVHDPLCGGGAFERAFVTVQRRMRPDWTIFSNPHVADSYLRTYKNLKHHSTILPGVDAKRLLQGANPERIRKQLGLSDTAPIIAMFARLQRAKGHAFLVEAAVQVLKQYPSACFVVCGGSLFGLEPDYPAELERLIQERGIADSFLMRGYVSDEERRDLLSAATVIAHPALHEPFGLCVVEGMAAGKPVVATECAGPKMTVVHGETGLLVPLSDVRAISDALLRILSQPQEAHRMGNRGRLRVESMYTIEAMVEQVEQVYAHIDKRYQPEIEARDYALLER